MKRSKLRRASAVALLLAFTLPQAAQAAANNRLIRRRNGVKRAIGGALAVLLACAALAG